MSSYKNKLFLTYESNTQLLPFIRLLANQIIHIIYIDLLKIHINKAYQEEKNYLISTLFGDYLGINYEIVFGEDKDYTITLGNQSITIGNHLFISEDVPYLTTDNVPSKVNFTDYQKLADNLPILYGTEKFNITDNSIFIDSDIFAACFFMLTRWEEVIDKDKDAHNRSKAKNSVAFKAGFIERPIVDEFVDLIWECLVKLNYKGKRKKQEFEFIHTHDVDQIEKWSSAQAVAKTVAGDILKRNSLQLAKANLRQSKATSKGIINDPYDTFEELMDLSDKIGVKSHFFFLHEGNHELDNAYEWNHPLFLKAISNIQERGHLIGLHPSYNSSINSHLLSKEKLALKRIIKEEPTIGRQHYLRFTVPETWQIWEDNEMLWDSSMYYSEQLGFRCGTCRDFPVFNVITRKQLSLRELPLSVMDSTFFEKIENGETESVYSEIKSCIELIQKHKGKFVLLWHTNYLNLAVFERHKALYLKVLDLL
ncbi:MAG: hypothetical protein HOH13_00445 [Crocinitomicaceae bacterium]|nr:hypothetical protein [Crocinitomicaceae bacterium]MBT6028747.1 hypothetical protein [Crocinitomicaceae bacterium]